jgi:hypothetical protein
VAAGEQWLVAAARIAHRHGLLHRRIGEQQYLHMSWQQAIHRATVLGGVHRQHPLVGQHRQQPA